MIAGDPASAVRELTERIASGLMQAYAEGFELLHSSEYGLDVEQIAARLLAALRNQFGGHPVVTAPRS